MNAPRVFRAAAIAALASAGPTACNPRIGEFEERGDRYSAQGAYADALVEYELALEEADGGGPGELHMKAGALALRSKSFSFPGRSCKKIHRGATVTSSSQSSARSLPNTKRCLKCWDGGPG